MRALITGAGGFVGHHLIVHLTEMGDDVIGTDRISGGPDLDDTVGLTRLFETVGPDVVYHLAGQSDVGGSWRRPVETYRANVEGTMNVLEAARSVGVGRIISVTSADIYGLVTEDELPLNEHAELRPVSPYAASKAAADLVCYQAFLGYNQQVVRARAFNHLGPGQSPQFLTAAIATRVVEAEVNGADTIRVGDLSARRDFTDVRDVVRAYRLLAEHGEGGKAYNVCTGVDVPAAQIAEMLMDLSTRDLRPVVDPTLLRPVDLPVLRGDPSRLMAETGWNPKISLTETLQDVLDAARGHLIRSTP